MKLIQGTVASETLVSGDTSDTLMGFDGHDLFVTGAGDDSIDGGLGNDTIKGDAGADTLIGDAGSDRLQGGSGSDSVLGGAGNDTVIVESSSPDTLMGGDGWNLIWARVSTNLSGSVINGFQELIVNEGNGTGIDEVILTAEQFNQFQIIRDGHLLGYGYELHGANAGLYDLSVRTVTGLRGFFGSLGNDTLRGDSLGNSLDGQTGNDVIEGLAGNDTLSGADGHDIVFGGEGNDLLSG